MTAFGVQIVATGNTRAAQSEFAKLIVQAQALNATLERVGTQGVSGFTNMQQAAMRSSAAFRAHAASSGMWETELMKVRSATESYTEALDRQKVSFMDWAKNRKLARAAYHEQLRLQEMIARQVPVRGPNGKQIFDVAVPTQTNRNLDTFANRVGWAREQLRSFSTQMVNWGKNTQWAGRQLMVGFTLPVVAFGAAAGVAAYQIDKELTRIQKVYDTTAQIVEGDLDSIAAAEKELAGVREAGIETARQAAREYASAATDTLAVQAELAATGLQGTSLQRSTSEVMRIATLGELERQDAINATIALQTIFKQSNSELTDSFNYMNAVENATSLQLKDFAQAIPIAAGPVKAFGGDIYELGVLMTAMRERGIEAAQGANALKATMQRLSRPSKQIQEEFAALTNGGDIVELVDNATSLSDIFSKLGDITRNLGDDAKRDIYAGLFGGWQVTRMTALVEGMADVENGVGQAGKAFQLAQGDAADWAAAADREIKKITGSVSGRFKAAFEELRLEMATLGEPFINAATTIIKFITKIIKGFNNMPDFAKKLIVIPAALLAIAGPLIMLVGLFANFAGNIGKMIVSVSGLLGRMGLLNKESALARAAAKLAEQGYISQAKSVQMLTAELHRLTLAQQASHAAALRNLPPGFAAAPTSGPVQGPALPPLAPGQGRTLTGYASGSAGASSGVLQIGGMQRQIDPAMARGARASDPIRNAQALASIESNRLHNQMALTRSAVAETTARQAGMRAASGTAATMGAMAAGMVLVSTSSNAVAQNIGQMLILGSLVVPAAVMLGQAMKGSVAATKAAVAAQLINARAARASALQLAAAAGNGNRLRGAVVATTAASRGLAAGLATVMGPIGWITAGVAAVGFGLYKLWQRNKDIIEEEKKHAKAVANSAGAYEDMLDIQKRSLQTVQATASAGKGQLNTRGMAAALLESESGKNLVSGFKDANEDRQNAIAATVYANTLNAVGGNAEKARKSVEALYLAAGKGAMEAEVRAYGLRSELNKVVDAGEQSDIWGDTLRTSLEDSEDAVRTGAAEMGKIWADSIARAQKKNGGDAAVTEMERVTALIKRNWENVFSNLEDWQVENLKGMGINSGAEMREFMSDYLSEMPRSMVEQKWDIPEGQAGMFFEQFEVNIVGAMEAAEKMRAQEQEIVNVFRTQLGIQEELRSLEEVMQSNEFKRFSVTKETAEAVYQQMLVAAELADANRDLTDEDKLRYKNIIRQKLGLEATNDLTAGWASGTKNVKDELRGSNSAVKRVNRSLWTTSQIIGKISNKDFGNMFKEAMSSLQQGMADDAMDSFTSQMDSALAATEAAGEARMDSFDNRAEAMQDAMDRRQEAAQNAMERRHEQAQNALERRQEAASEALERRQEARRKAVEASYERRIKAIEGAIEAEQKAEEIRQRIFDAEMTRLDRLNVEQNRNIDFNVALNSGDLDEAARIRNDMMSQESQWNLEDAANAGARGSDRRIERLENRRDAVDEARDKELEALEKVEEREKKSLERRLEAQKRMLERRQEMQANALERSAERERKALEDSLDRQREQLEKSVEQNNDAERQKWEDRQRNLEKSLEDFTDYVALNEKDLRRHIKEWKAKHKDLSTYTKDKFDITADKINRSITTSVRQSMRSMANEVQWENNGAKIAKGMIQGAFGLSMGQFKKWMLTGKYPGKAEQAAAARRKGKRTSTGGPSRNRPYQNNASRHTGGPVGGGKDSRKGVARTLKGLHPSEVMVRARKGEFVVNEKATAQNRALLEAVNSGKYTTRHEGGMVGNSKALGFAGVAGGMLAAAVKSAINRGVEVGAEEGRQRQAALALGRSYFDGTFRHYNLPGVKPWVLDAANYLGNKYNIATIGGVGERSNASEHPLGRALDFMISSNRGTALAEEVIRLHRDLDAMYVIWRQRIHSFDDRGWRQMEDRGNATANHFDHVHVSFNPTGDVGDLPSLTANATGAAFGTRGGIGEVNVGRGGNYGGRDYGRQQMENAAIIARVGKRMGLGLRDIKIGIMTAIAESGLVNVNYGDRDSLGLFQQRPSQGWGTPAQVTNPVYAAGRFFAALKGVGNRDSMVPWMAAQTVQRSAFSNGSNYRPYWDDSAGIMRATQSVYLKTGGTVLKDNVPAVLHRNETVLTEPLSKQLKSSIGSLSKLDTLQELDQLAISQIKTQKAITEIARKSSGKGGNADNGDPGRAMGIRTGTHNVARFISNARTKPDLRRIMGMTDVLSLTEMIGAKRGLIPWIRSQGWGYFGNQGRADDTAIAWNQAKFELLRSGHEMLNPNTNTGRGTGRNRGATYGLLRNKQTGGRFWQISAHTIGHAQRSLGRWRPIMQEQYGNLLKLMNRLKGTGSPVVLAGDLNTNPKKAGFRPRFKGFNDLTTRGGNGLDRIYTSLGIKNLGVDRIRKLASDHPALLADLRIPGLNVGGFTLSDGIARLHKNETVLTEPLSKQLIRGIERLDTGSNSAYTTVNVYGAPGMDEGVLAQRVVTMLDRRAQRRPQSRRG